MLLAHARRRGLGRSRRPAAVALVALTVACSVLINFGTRDAAQALPIAPPIVAAAAGTLGAPATVLAFNPAGFAVAAAAGLGWLAWDNRETVGNFASDAWDWITGSDAESDGQVRQRKPIGVSDDTPLDPAWNSHYADLYFTVTAGSSPEKVMTERRCVKTALGAERKLRYGDDVCGEEGRNYLTSGPIGYRAVCRTADGQFRIRGHDAPDLAVVGVGRWARYDPEPSELGVCQVGETVKRVTWWNTSEQAGWRPFPGMASFGDVPTKVRIDRICALDANPDPLNNVTIIGQETYDDGTYSVPACPPGYSPIAERIYTGIIGDPGWLLSQTIDVGAEAGASYPECIGSSGQLLNCKTRVFVNGTECTTGRAPCWDWLAFEQANPGQVECRWGPYRMPLEDCAPLREAYRTGYYANDGGGSGWYSSNPDGTPSPYTGGSPNPGTAPNPAPQPTPGNNPGGDPGSNTGADPDGDGENCWAAMISWNPVDWVVTPVKCALWWAFVPEEGYLATQMHYVGQSWQGTVVGRWFASVGDAAAGFAAGPAPGGCLGPPLTVSMALVGGGESTMHPFATCEQPMSTVAAIVRAALTVALWLGVAFLGVRFIASAVGLDLSGWGRDRDGDGP